MKKITIKIVPRASRNEIIGPMSDGTLKVAIKAAPVDGKANEALLNFLSDAWNVPAASLSIIRGHHGKLKVIQIED